MVNKQVYIDFIIDCFGKGVIERGEVMAKFGEMWQTPPRTFDRYFKKAKEAYSEQRKEINDAKMSTAIEMEVEAVRSEINSKLDRLRILQKEIEDCVKELESGITTQTFVIDGSTTDHTRSLTVAEKVALRKAIKELQSEISKIEGDYAPIQNQTETKIILKDVE